MNPKVAHAFRSLERTGVLLAALGSCAPSVRAESGGGFAAPAPTLLEQLRREHDPRHWLRITTPSTRWEARARKIGDDGLSGLKLRRIGPRPPDPIPWSSIARIDVRESRDRLGQVVGLTVGGTFGAVAGGAVASDMGIFPGALACGLAGAWLAGKIGDRIVTERPLYVAYAAADRSEAVQAADPISRLDATTGNGPSSNVLFQLQEQNHQSPWLRVSTDSARWTLQARRIDSQGLSGITSRGSDPPPPDPIAWSSVRQLNEVITRARGGGILGFAGLGLVGAGLGNAIGAKDRTGGQLALLGLTVLGSVGAWQGSRFGSHFVRERSWYAGAPLPSRMETAAPIAADSVTVGAPDSVTTAAKAVRPGNSDPEAAARISQSPGVRRAIRRIGPDDLIRARGDFGRFQGFATVGPVGMEGLRRDFNDARYGSSAVPAGPITWDRIDHVELRGNSWRRGALIGGLSLGILGGLAAGGFAAGFSDERDRNLTFVGAALYGGAITGAAGAVIGGLIGATVTGWHSVYDGP